MLTRKIIIVLDIKVKQIFKLVYYMQTVEIPTIKGANSYQLKISKNRGFYFRQTGESPLYYSCNHIYRGIGHNT